LKAPQNTSLARKLRIEQTDAERMLWSKLRNEQVDGVKFRRQQPIKHYIVDFVSFEKNLIIELDGGYHNEDHEKIKDEQRTRWMEGQGFHVLRFWNNDVLQNIDGVLNSIIEAIK
jgi:very-short-patch-repair endonuclease